MDLLLEADRIDDKLKECTSLLSSVFHDRVNDIVVESHHISTGSFTSDAIDGSVTNVEAASSEMAIPQPVGSNDLYTNVCTNPELPVKTRAYSKIKRIGARCCFRWPNDNAPFRHWGTIIESSTDDQVQKKYVVRLTLKLERRF
jgi:hypothetical protein